MSKANKDLIKELKAEIKRLEQTITNKTEQINQLIEHINKLTKLIEVNKPLPEIPKYPDPYPNPNPFPWEKPPKPWIPRRDRIYDYIRRPTPITEKGRKMNESI